MKKRKLTETAVKGPSHERNPNCRKEMRQIQVMKRMLGGSDEKGGGK